MAAAQAVFERHEKKYMLTKSQCMVFKKRIVPFMEHDQYGLHTICSVYYDTEDYQIIRNAGEKPAYKEKLRLRSYGVPRADDTVFLELKKKFNGVTYKRRMPMCMREAGAYLQAGIRPAQTGQIFEEIDWFRRFHQLEPKVLLCYDRIALFGKEDPQLRITFDTDIRWRSSGLDLSKGDYGKALIGPDKTLMEIKTLGPIPCWLSGMLSAVGAYPISFSKYGTVYRNNLVKKGVQRYA